LLIVSSTRQCFDYSNDLHLVILTILGSASIHPQHMLRNPENDHYILNDQFPFQLAVCKGMTRVRLAQAMKQDEVMR
jgi:hypothetical protein